MKLPAHAWRTFWAYHAWAGVSTGLLLHVMFVAGAVTLFLAPLKVWEEPVQHRPASEAWQASPQVLLERGQAAIAELPSVPKRLWLGLPQGEAGAARFQYSDLKTGKWRAGWLDGARFVPERESLSTFVYHLHYLWHPALPALAWLAGFASVAFLLIVVTGVLIHVKDLVRQLVQFRPQVARRVFWSDLHKVLGVMGLPFQLLYCYTGALLVFGPVLITALDAPAKIAWNEPTQVPAVGDAIRPRSLDEVLAAAKQAVPGLAPISFGMQDRGKAHALVRVYGEIRGEDGAFQHANVVIDQSTAEVIHVESPETDLASHATRRWVSGLHYTYFGGGGLRVILAMLALAASGTILSGNWIWLARRRKRGAAGRPHALARWTAGIGAGVFVAIAAMFVASRALPMELVGRAAIEQWVFGGALIGCVIWALRARDVDGVWWRQLAVAGALLVTVPVWAARVSPAGLLGGGPLVSTVVAVDAGVLGAGLGLICVAWALRRRWLRGQAAAAEDAGEVDDAGEVPA